MVVRGDDDLVSSDEDLVYEVLEELLAGLGRVDRGLGEALVERANGSFILKEGGFDVFCLDGLIEIAFLFFQCTHGFGSGVIEDSLGYCFDEVGELDFYIFAAGF
ncbi:MAG: hypothetical protein E6X52_07710 [Actinomyces sp.]|uniref:hypothetical protein n=1 Tax=uncultured Actinomyces sp. TaxID=249061 RepID=UPI002805B418|nr:hypothetical protein [uncultured Actinomyces sp.]MDU4832409.1 hypothetical protein [Actinomyces sp.]